MNENIILNEIREQLSNLSNDDGKVSAETIEKQFKQIEISEIKNGDHFLIALDISDFDLVNIDYWPYIEIWKFYKTTDSKLHILEFDNKNLFNVNELMAMISGNDPIKKDEKRLSVHDYRMYSYFDYQMNGNESIFYRNSTSVYGYRLPDSFDMNNRRR